MDTLETTLAEIVADSGALLPAETAQEASDLIDNREYGVALELVCEQLYECSAPVTPQLYRLIESAARQMEMEAKSWAYVAELVR